MKLFSWVHNKLNRKQGSNNAKVISLPIKREEKEEFSDWPQAFLSIGTLGNKVLKEEQEVLPKESDFESDPDNLHNLHENLTSDLDDLQNSHENLTLEQLRELQKELDALVSNPNYIIEENIDHEETHDDEDKQFSTINGSNNYNNAIGRKSFSFLLKKMFICGFNGLGPTPSLRDPTHSSPHSTMHKILRALLKKKIHPQNSSQSMSKKKYLKNAKMITKDDNDHDCDHSNYGIKWVKTDTEYIVLEI